MFNIKLPFNFDSPYKSTSISEFWQRWHISLGRFLRNYIYIPLGGNRVSIGRNALNFMIVFLIGGFWHGAAWTFIFWGFLHGSAMVVEKLFSLLKFKLPQFISWFLTFNFVNITWVFFRAKTWHDSIKVLSGMFGRTGMVVHPYLKKIFKHISHNITYGEWNKNLIERPYYSNRILLYLFCFSILAFRFKNSQELILDSKVGYLKITLIYALFMYSLLLLGNNPQFLYFNF